jgi:hypothetical protein
MQNSQQTTLPHLDPAECFKQLNGNLVHECNKLHGGIGAAFGEGKMKATCRS